MEDPSTLSEQEELLWPLKHHPTLENQPSSLQMGQNLSVLVLASLQSLGQILYL